MLIVPAAAMIVAAGPAELPVAPVASGIVAERCGQKPTADIVVCGKSNDAYRIEPSVLAADRAAESARDNAPNAAVPEGAACAVGPRGCPAVLPVTQMALVVAQALVRAATGDDWREGLRTAPDDYRLYHESQAKEARRPHISIGVGLHN